MLRCQKPFLSLLASSNSQFFDFLRHPSYILFPCLEMVEWSIFNCSASCCCVCPSSSSKSTCMPAFFTSKSPSRNLRNQFFQFDSLNL
uniref:Putative secreted protein n=1 Tax=Xenopsylla cheopis TaxID=163159 RepID=A0A6M2DHP9_XENCH